MSRYRALAPAKINLGLFLGPTREADGRHELVTVMQSISLADELTLEPVEPAATPAARTRVRSAATRAVRVRAHARARTRTRAHRADLVVCPGVAGAPEENLAAAALRAFRARTGWDAPAQLLRIDKRIPVAAGLAGGSADAAAALRLASHASGLDDPALLHELARELGADVPAQVTPGRWLASGAGERLRELPSPASPLVVLVLPDAATLATADVYAEADRLALSRSPRELTERAAEIAAALANGAPVPAASELLHNDLQRAAVSLRPEIAATLRQARACGADFSFVSGSGPTVIGLFLRAGRSGSTPVDGPSLAAQAAATLAARVGAHAGAHAPAPTWATPVDADFAAVHELR